MNATGQLQEILLRSAEKGCRLMSWKTVSRNTFRSSEQFPVECVPCTVVSRGPTASTVP